MDIVEDAAYFLELPILGWQSSMLELMAQFFNFPFRTSGTAKHFTAGPADDEAEGGKEQDPEQGVSRIFCHADFSMVVEACSWSTRWMVARETR